MAYAEIWGGVPFWAWWLFVANLFWVIAYDTEYAMVDRPDDLRIGIRSSAIFFGRADVAAIATCYGLYLGMVAVMGFAYALGWGFWVAWGGGVGMAVRHLGWIRAREAAPCFRAFRDNHWLGLLLLAGLIAGQHTGMRWLNV
jgi:4-hydroxybenzoate polyprenyltransferase